MLMGWIANGGLLTAAAMPLQLIVLAARNAMERIYPKMKQNARTQRDAGGDHAGRGAAGIMHPKLRAMLILIAIGQTIITALK